MQTQTIAVEGGRKSLLEVIKSMDPRVRWKGNNGYSHVLRICLPLIASNISVSAMLFTDRLFLSHYSIEAIAASLPAGVTVVTVSSFFQGLVAYVSVFTAQYTGAGRPHRAAAALWQGLYIALLSGILLAATYFMAPWIFRLGGHPENVRHLEVIYYRVLAVPTAINLMYFAMSSFLAGLGRTRMVMWVNLIGALVNIPLTGILVFGVEIGGVRLAPEWGITGAAVATVVSWVVTALIFAVLIFNRKMEKSHSVFTAWKVDWRLMWRLIYYGSPGGLQRFLELAAFTFFAFIVGRLGELYLAANNIVFSIEALSFFPMIGVGVTISIMVGQSIGRGRPEEASEAVVSGIGISSVYLVSIAVVFLLFPKSLMSLFMAAHYDATTAGRILELGVISLRFVVLYTVFDGLFLCCFGALSGAGDVWFPMAAMGLSGFFGLAVPIWGLFAFDLANIYTLWSCFVFYLLALTAAGVWRFRLGKWRSMRVIEKV
ncbi:MAG: MATE family efflux transporter [Candidatus Adiutrix sp.]|jgi:MATE family multidrug resistance protein|nr:MATE family efflux transporter [Candidatus Adiutrix sp.]